MGFADFDEGDMADYFGDDIFWCDFMGMEV